MRRSVISLISGLLFALIAVALLYNYVQGLQRSAQPGGNLELATVVVAAKDLPFGSPLKRDELKEVAWPKASIPQGAFANVDAIFADAKQPGDRIALFLVAHDEPLTTAKVSGFGARPTMSRQVTNGMRAISVRVDDV